MILCLSQRRGVAEFGGCLCGNSFMMKLNDIRGEIIDAAIAVHRELGPAK